MLLLLYFVVTVAAAAAAALFWSNHTVRAFFKGSRKFLKISPSHPELPPAELVFFSFAYELFKSFFLCLSFICAR